MEIDSLFLKGTGHTICQDYTTHWQTPQITAAILCDGCSGSPKTDIGARLLAEAFGASLIELHGPNHLEGKFPENLSASLLSNLKNRLLSVCQQLSLNLGCLDATLLAAVSSKNEDIIRLFLWGDGHIIVKKTDGTIHHWNISYENNAPFYFSYSLVTEGQTLYADIFGDPNPDLIYEIIQPNGEKTKITGNPTPLFVQEIPKEEVECICLFSDGIETFSSPTQERIPYTEILDEISAFKGYPGAFVARRLLKFQKDCAKKGYSHFDDISCAALALPNE